MEFVTIANPGGVSNASDTDTSTNAPFFTAGAVAYDYGIGKFEVSRRMIEAYNAGNVPAKAISLFDMSTLGGNGLDKPATGITWNEAARFVNWLNTSTGGQAAYKFTSDSMTSNISQWDSTSDPLDYNPSNKFRSLRAKFVLPDVDEWYKAAYYDPNNSTYGDFPNGSDTAPQARTGLTSDQTTNTAVYYDGGFFGNYSIGPANVDQAGGLSPYGVMGLGGNVAEWNEDTFEFDYDPAENRITRGGSWYSGDSSLKNISFNHFNPTSTGEDKGFRVVTLDTSYGAVPEPTSITIFGLGALGFAYQARRKRSKE
jgi:hypothetical protein